jgi:hypothetical protein
MVFRSDFDEDHLKNRIDSVYKQFSARRGEGSATAKA